MTATTTCTTVDEAMASFDNFRHWHDIDWVKCHEKVKNLQARIVKATAEGRCPLCQYDLRHLPLGN